MTCHDDRMSSVARRLSIRRFMLGNPVMRTVLSLWAWLVLGIVIVVWLPLVAIVWAVTAPFDRGRYAALVPPATARRNATSRRPCTASCSTRPSWTG